MPPFPESEADKFPSMRLTFPNTYFDPHTAHDLFKRYLDEYQYAEEVGFDGLMINEHHNTPSCMDVEVNITGGILARVTSRAKILMLGKYAAHFRQPGASGRGNRHVGCHIRWAYHLRLRARHRHRNLG